ncbi:hypothetical protein [Bradyrhizobium sp. JYMT SZCCT0428]|uniref:hypothetical protein n=1 Tax=Bradyrhizobium sp. JYMT SZCCT0428 TaxID=2807673 RepID=UPI001BADE033|nr:hypothetical protein [Bradyrhizobium sp. JYMT SZCCT0428]MBR1152970.1 hypothetical protein [Bradyrhizobium sp. JYMT SZCCT0428]
MAEASFWIAQHSQNACGGLKVLTPNVLWAALLLILWMQRRLFGLKDADSFCGQS